jgi:hypothetical protein
MQGVGSRWLATNLEENSAAWSIDLPALGRKITGSCRTRFIGTAQGQVHGHSVFENQLKGTPVLFIMKAQLRFGLQEQKPRKIYQQMIARSHQQRRKSTLAQSLLADVVQQYAH